MKQFFNYFKIPFILIAIMIIVCIGVRISKSGSTEITWTNEDTDLTGNVFDYAENLTDAQERELDELISSIEDRVKCDIAVITLDQTLSLRGYKSEPSKWVMEYADDFADEHKMGYDKAYGNSIVFIDNLHREERTGRVYSWISTSGRSVPLSFSRISVRLGLTAIPLSVTSTSTVSPGVVTVITLSLTRQRLPFFIRSLTMMEILLPAAVSALPPEELMITPLDPVLTFTLKSKAWMSTFP